MPVQRDAVACDRRREALRPRNKECRGIVDPGGSKTNDLRRSPWLMRKDQWATLIGGHSFGSLAFINFLFWSRWLLM